MNTSQWGRAVGNRHDCPQPSNVESYSFQILCRHSFNIGQCATTSDLCSDDVHANDKEEEDGEENLLPSLQLVWSDGVERENINALQKWVMYARGQNLDNLNCGRETKFLHLTIHNLVNMGIVCKDNFLPAGLGQLCSQSAKWNLPPYDHSSSTQTSLPLQPEWMS